LSKGCPSSERSEREEQGFDKLSPNGSEVGMVGNRAPSRYQRPQIPITGRIMTDTPPDRLSVNPRSPLYDAEVLQRDVGIRFNGTEKHNVEEYCVSEGWIKVAAGRAVDRKGNPMTLKLKGTVEPYFKRAAPAADAEGDAEG
jgi:hypothetical protein